MTEKHYNDVFGTASVGSITLTGGGTTATFAAAPVFPTIGGGDFVKIIVEPDSPNEEIIYVTAYTSAAPTATVTRNAEATQGGQNNSNAHTAVAWVHGPTAANVSKIVAGTNVTTSDDGMGNVTVNASGGVATGVLAVKTVQGGADSQYSTSSAFPVDADATNLAIAFTAPASGAVIVRLCGASAISSAAQNGYWGLREAAATIAQSLGPGITNGTCLSMDYYISGLVAGSAHTYKWAYGVSGGATIDLFHGPTYGTLVMQVWTAV